METIVVNGITYERAREPEPKEDGTYVATRSDGTLEFWCRIGPSVPWKRLTKEGAYQWAEWKDMPRTTAMVRVEASDALRGLAAR
jgi:hypothetical protein